MNEGKCLEKREREWWSKIAQYNNIKVMCVKKKERGASLLKR
jgi:hypothetical protein